MSRNELSDTVVADAATTFDVDVFDVPDGRIRFGISFCIAFRRLVDVCCCDEDDDVSRKNEVALGLVDPD